MPMQKHGITQAKVIRFRKDNPCMSCASIARKVGVSRERVRQLLARSHLRTRVKVSKTCSGCGKRLSYNTITGLCRQCLSAQAHITLVCDYCGKEFTRLACMLTYQIGKRGYQHVYCNRKCVGKVAGEKYGFAAHPENAELSRILGLRRKWNWDAVIQLYSEGLSQVEVGRRLGIPYQTVNAIVRHRRQNGK